MIKEFMESIKPALTRASFEIPNKFPKGKKYIETDFVSDLFEAKLKQTEEKLNSYSAREYLQEEYGFPVDNFSDEEIETLCHFAECYAKFVNFNL